MSLKISIPLLKKPEGVECEEVYGVGPYKICISRGKYIPYDPVSEEPNAEAVMTEVVDELRQVLVEKEGSFEELFEKVPEGFRHIVQRQIQGYGVLEPLLQDGDIIDVHIVFDEARQPQTSVQVIHRRYGRLETDVPLTFEELREVVLRISSLAGKVVSEAKPLLSFIEPRYSARVSLVYYSDVTLRRGMSVDIRKQPEKPWTILKLIDIKTLSIEEAAYLWLAMKYKIPILVLGEMMSGKTTLINAVLNLVPPGSRVITIEDTPELKVYTRYWVRTTTRESETHPVSIFSLIKNAVRMSVDYIVVGEIRGEEAREWAQAILLGHGGITSFHAPDPETALTRLKTPPIEVNPQALRMLNIFVKMIPMMSRTGRLERRSELYVYEDDRLHKLFSYDPEVDAISRHPEVNPLGFKYLERILMGYGVPKKYLEDEYVAMMALLQDLYNQFKQADPALEAPDYRELAHILYSKLDEYISKVETGGAL